MMMTLLFYLGLSLFSFNSKTATLPHDFHVSKCLVEYSAPDQALQISLHLFLDDLEEALRRQGADQLFLCTEKEHPEGEKYLERYLRQYFQFVINGEPAEYTFLGKEISDDLQAVWCYMEIPGLASLQQLEVTNALLMDLYDDQKNLVSVIGPQQEQGLMLFEKNSRTESVRF